MSDATCVRKPSSAFLPSAGLWGFDRFSAWLRDWTVFSNGPIASQIDSERDKWRALARPPLFAAVSPYSDGPEAVLATGERLQAEGAEAVLLDCIGFTERHRDTLAALDVPVILSNALVAKAVGELFGG